MVRFIFTILAIFLINFCVHQRYNYFIESKNYDSISLPEEFKKTGMLSSSTYQIFLKVRADTYEEALLITQKEILEIAYYYITLEPFMLRTLSPYGKQQIFDLIKNKGKVVLIKRNLSENVYDVVFHVSEYDLRNYLRKIK